jgi:hypothetical protein
MRRPTSDRALDVGTKITCPQKIRAVSDLGTTPRFNVSLPVLSARALLPLPPIRRSPLLLFLADTQCRVIASESDLVR